MFITCTKQTLCATFIALLLHHYVFKACFSTIIWNNIRHFLLFIKASFPSYGKNWEHDNVSASLSFLFLWVITWKQFESHRCSIERKMMPQVIIVWNIFLFIFFHYCVKNKILILVRENILDKHRVFSSYEWFCGNNVKSIQLNVRWYLKSISSVIHFLFLSNT